MNTLRQRTVETVTATAIALAGGIVAAESLTHDVGWDANGPRPGYFPFRVGLLMIATGLVLGFQSLKIASATFASGDELRRSVSVFWPTAALVAGIMALGCYVPSAIYLAWMMRRHGGYRLLTSAACGVGVMIAFFLIFDVWFRVPLAKGPVEAALGVY